MTLMHDEMLVCPRRKYLTQETIMGTSNYGGMQVEECVKRRQSIREGILSDPRQNPVQRNKRVDILGFFREL